MKKCNLCEQEKEIDNFYIKKYKNGKHYTLNKCKKCYNQSAKKYEIKCFRCGINSKSENKKGYCSKKCQLEGMRERAAFKMKWRDSNDELW